MLCLSEYAEFFLQTYVIAKRKKSVTSDKYLIYPPAAY